MNAHWILMPVLLTSICAVRPSPDAAPTASLMSLNEKGFQTYTHKTTPPHIYGADLHGEPSTEESVSSERGTPSTEAMPATDTSIDQDDSPRAEDLASTEATSSKEEHAAPKEEERNELDFSKVDNGPLELAAPLKWDVKDRYFGDLLNLQHELDPTAGKVKDMLDKDESHEPMVKDHFEAWLSAADFQRTHGNLEFRKSMEKVLDKVKGEKAIIKDGIEHWKALHHEEKPGGQPWWKPAHETQALASMT